MAVPPLGAQGGAPTFDVASVKTHVQGSGFAPLSCVNGRYFSLGFPLVYVIEWAYDLNTDQNRQVEEHLPKWMSPTTAYDIEAKGDPSVTVSQCRVMMQTLLADRFKFAAHWESKDVEVSNLVVARGGPKLQNAAETDDGTDVHMTLNGKIALVGPRTGLPKGLTMQEFAASLTQGRRLEPVYDKTGLEGRYKIDLKFSIPPAVEVPRCLKTPIWKRHSQLQMGLKLEKGKGSMEAPRCRSHRAANPELRPVPLCGFLTRIVT